MNPSSIICPNCKTTISLDEVITHELEESVEKKYEAKREKEREEERGKMRLWQERREKELVQKNEQDAKLLREDSERKDKVISEFRENELALRKKTRELEEREKNLELEKQRQIDGERKKIQEAEQKKAKEEYQLPLAEEKKLTQDLLKQIEELKQKATQGSQQSQGEILELELEQILKNEFPVDDIIPVPKGMNGADVMQKVRDGNGKECGVIIWESKRTKFWEDEWIQKLKTDMRSSKSDLAIIVSTQLPKGILNFGPKDGVLVTSFENFLPLAKLMRLKIIELYYAKVATEGVNDKKEILWKYLTSNEFKQRLESIVESFNRLKALKDKQKQWLTRMWAEEQKLLDVVVDQTVGMHGDLQGLMGDSLPQIKSLEMDNFELIETTQISIGGGNIEATQTQIITGHKK